MMRWIRIRCRSSISYPYNTPSISLKIQDNRWDLNQMRFMWPMITASYADRPSPPSLNGLKDRSPEQSMAPGTFFRSHTLSFLRWDHLNLGREPRMRHRINRPVFHLGACRIFPEEVVTVPIRRRSNRSRDEPAAAIWTDTSQNVFDTGHAERALIRADARLKRLWRQRPVAMLTSRSEFKHGVLDESLSKTGNQWFLEPFSSLCVRGPGDATPPLC
jgi:hypothetical protein